MLSSARALPAALAVAVLALTACSPTSADAPQPLSGSKGAVAQQDAAPARLLANVSGPTVALHHRITVEARRGDLDDVTLTAPDGSTVAGRIRDGVWRQLGGLLPRTRYLLAASGTNAAGQVTTRSWRLRTTAPATTDQPAVTPLDGGTVGVGHPVVVYFHHDVTDKGLVEQRMDISTSQPVEGSWGWLDDRTAAWRPREFWPAETDVEVTLALAGTELGDGVCVMEDGETDFHVGLSQVLRIDDATHTMHVQREEGVVRTVEVSMGKPGFTTRSGTKVIMTREESRRMDSATVDIGGDEAYDLEVPYAMRLTSTGEFIHGAPWSEHAQGSENVSHGCTNVSLEDAIWLYDNTLIGDPVVTSGTGRDMEEWNGLGGLWNYTWDEWQQR